MRSPTLTPELPLFKQQQYAFAAYIRDPNNNPLPEGIEHRRMAMYRELFFNNIDSFLSSNFPVLHKILDESQWAALAQDYFANHHNQSPYFSEIPEEFLDYLQHEREPQADDLPFLLELAHYEWVEMALSIAEGAPPVPEQNNILEVQPLTQTIQLSDLAWPLVYQFPVQQISPDFQPQHPPPQPTYLVVYRNANDSIQFMQLNAVSYRLLQLLQDNGPTPARQALLTIAEELKHPNPAIVLSGGEDALKGLAQRSIIQIAQSNGEP